MQFRDERTAPPVPQSQSYEVVRRVPSRTGKIHWISDLPVVACELSYIEYTRRQRNQTSTIRTVLRLRLQTDGRLAITHECTDEDETRDRHTHLYGTFPAGSILPFGADTVDGIISHKTDVDFCGLEQTESTEELQGTVRLVKGKNGELMSLGLDAVSHAALLRNSFFSQN
eukprot:gnl/Spiro4/24310_TR12074_c0_g1_i1.p1 gnl/Spiro4/24310_TR12074_c0_g1~~gnl/Spiro4/24310_TR12074_c0_g1_i1.p1  ORF type:complete len:171 (-),score=31.90 gnl/Spiro4/24310_TR12074_c0_g1_i1:104-616(-)